MSVKKILVTGASGQIGTELVPYLRGIYGKENVIATARRIREDSSIAEQGPFALLDVTKPAEVSTVMREHHVLIIYHLASLLSATGEEDPQSLWEINVNGLINILEAAREKGSAVFFPSSIAVFGPGVPKEKTPQEAPTRPATIYGIAKVTGELLCQYYHHKYNLDIRGLRYPGIISSEAMPGGGTTDYAVHIFYEALTQGHYTCFLRQDSAIDMIYMPDALKGAVQLMETDPGKLTYRNAYNVSAITLTPRRLCQAIKKHLPHFQIDYAIDPVRQGIADSWPDSLDDSVARAEWAWNPQYDLELMTAEMLEKLSARLKC